MEQKFNNNPLGLQTLREFCEREGEEIAYPRVTSWNARVTQHGGSPLLLKRDFGFYPLLIIYFACLNFFSLSFLGGSSPQTPRCFSCISLGLATN